MEVYEPLADVPPPRYAVESDDDEHYPQSASTASEKPFKFNVEIKSTYDIPRRRPLIFASGEAGVNWAKTVDLCNEQRASIYINDLLVGLVFSSSRTRVVIVMSEAEYHTKLPLFAMTTYATTIIDHLRPTSVAILDSYSTQAYISEQVISQDTAPIRYLSIGKNPVPDSGLELFRPPNLLQSTTASLLNTLFLRSLREESTGDAIAAILLPSSKIPRPPPTALNSRWTAGDFADTNWQRETLEKAHKWLFAIVGEEAGEPMLCSHAKSVTSSTIPVGKARPSLGQVGEGGMYI